jgi:hypothetical protein
LNDCGYSGDSIWALPDHPVFVDGGADADDWNSVVDEYLRWAGLESDPHILLDKYKIDLCLLTAQSPMARILPLIGPWQPVYQDDSSVVLIRAIAAQR